MLLNISEHARTRMQERNVSYAEIVQTIQDGVIVYQNDEAVRIDSDDVGVVLGSDLVVITVYRHETFKKSPNPGEIR